MLALCAACLAIAIVPLASLLWLVVRNGIGGLSLSFFTQRPMPVGEPGGGVGNAIVGTLMMVGLASAIGIPLGVGVGVFLAEHGEGRWARVVRFTADVLTGVPSIVVGVVAYGLVVIPMGRFSALAGAIALAMLLMPPLARATEEIVRLVPRPLREAALALGVPAWKTSIRVVLRTALSGILTVALLGIARIAGETAPLLFTALNNQYWSLRPDQPMASLTVQIFNYAISPYEDWHRKAWAAALTLLVLVAGLNLAARWLTRRKMKGTA